MFVLSTVSMDVLRFGDTKVTARGMSLTRVELCGLVFGTKNYQPELWHKGTELSTAILSFGEASSEKTRKLGDRDGSREGRRG